jgi:hypothetical protein
MASHSPALAGQSASNGLQARASVAKLFTPFLLGTLGSRTVKSLFPFGCQHFDAQVTRISQMARSFQHGVPVAPEGVYLGKIG